MTERSRSQVFESNNQILHHHHPDMILCISYKSSQCNYVRLVIKDTFATSVLSYLN